MPDTPSGVDPRRGLRDTLKVAEQGLAGLDAARASLANGVQSTISEAAGTVQRAQKGLANGITDLLDQSAQVIGKAKLYLSGSVLGTIGKGQATLASRNLPFHPPPSLGAPTSGSAPASCNCGPVCHVVPCRPGQPAGEGGHCWLCDICIDSPDVPGACPTEAWYCCCLPGVGPYCLFGNPSDPTWPKCTETYGPFADSEACHLFCESVGPLCIPDPCLTTDKCWYCVTVPPSTSTTCLLSTKQHLLDLGVNIISGPYSHASDCWANCKNLPPPPPPPPSEFYCVTGCLPGKLKLCAGGPPLPLRPGLPSIVTQFCVHNTRQEIADAGCTVVSGPFLNCLDCLLACGVPPPPPPPPPLPCPPCPPPAGCCPPSTIVNQIAPTPPCPPASIIVQNQINPVINPPPGGGGGPPPIGVGTATCETPIAVKICDCGVGIDAEWLDKDCSEDWRKRYDKWAGDGWTSFTQADTLEAAIDKIAVPGDPNGGTEIASLHKPDWPDIG